MKLPHLENTVIAEAKIKGCLLAEMTMRGRDEVRG